MRQSYTAVLARNEEWAGRCQSEPYEVAWAHEAIVFVRLLAQAGPPEDARFRIQLSPDGMRWADEGTELAAPCRLGELAWARIGRFGTFLRVAADLPDGFSCKVLITCALKE